MASETAKYRLSVYQPQELIKETQNCRIETVFCTLDEKIYIQRTYPEDKRELFNALKEIEDARIPRMIEVIFDENTTVIEEYIQGGELSVLIENGRITRKQAHKLAKQIFEALDALHNHNIIHRDVKPGNILVDQNGGIWLIDFGIARLYDETARHDTQHLGTVGYAPPEQFGFSQSDFRSDLYAAGVTIEEIGKSAGCPSHSPVMKAAGRCREFDPSRRYASASAALHDISLKQIKKKAALAIALLVAGAAVLSAYMSMDRSNERDIAMKMESPSEAEERLKDEDVIGWFPIIESYSDEPIAYTALFADTALETQKIGLSKDGPEIELLYELENGVFQLTLDDQALPGQSFSFSYNPAYPPDYPSGTAVEAEILFYDMNGDGQYEILVALSDRKRMLGVKDVLLCNTYWRAVWCIGYARDEGFWQADGMMVTYGNHGSIYLDYLGERELYSNNTYVFMRLADRALQEI